jgi:hypothetical protein
MFGMKVKEFLVIPVLSGRIANTSNQTGKDKTQYRKSIFNPMPFSWTFACRSAAGHSQDWQALVRAELRDERRVNL